MADYRYCSVLLDLVVEAWGLAPALVLLGVVAVEAVVVEV